MNFVRPLATFRELPTLDVFVVPGDVLQLGEADGLGADEGSHPLRVGAALENSPVAHDHRVDVGVHLGVDEGDVVNQVDPPVTDRFDRGWTAAVHALSRGGGETEFKRWFSSSCMCLK